MTYVGKNFKSAVELLVTLIVLMSVYTASAKKTGMNADMLVITTCLRYFEGLVLRENPKILLQMVILLGNMGRALLFMAL